MIELTEFVNNHPKIILEQEQYERLLGDFIRKELLQQRINKAIEYIHKNYPVCAGKELLEILEGENNENN